MAVEGVDMAVERLGGRGLTLDRYFFGGSSTAVRRGNGVSRRGIG